MDALIRVPKVLQDAKQTERSLKGNGDGDFRGIVRKISLMVRMGSNPHRHGSDLFERY